MTREEAYKTIKENLCAMCAYGSQCMESCDISTCDNREAIKVLEQEPDFDKLRAEIETKYGQCKLTEYIVQYDGICTSVNDIGDIADILQIIDKYKAETE